MRPGIRFRIALIALACAALYFGTRSGSDAGFIQTQRAQTAVNIIINVTPGPYGYVPAQNSAIAGAHRDGRGGGDGFKIIAQASVQHAVPVQANVTPNPTATLFVITPNSATLSATAGGPSVTVTCAFTVKIMTSISLWTVDQGLSNDFSPSFNGANLWNNTYVSVPNPTSTPYIVYPDNNNAWSIMAKSGGTQTYCVDLTVTVPVTVLSGVYTTNAVYTLFY